MYFDLEDRFFDTPTVESAMSWRERGLLSLFAHVALVLLYLFGPSLPFVRDAAERRAERLEALAAEQFAMRAPVEDQPQFIFVEPFVDTPSPEPPPQASLSDLDRTAQSPVQAETPLNTLPNADGNAFEFVQAEELSDGLDPETGAGTDPAAVDGDAMEPVEGVEDGVVDPPDEETLETSPGDGAVANPFLADGSDALLPPKLTPTPGALLRQAERRLDSVSRGQSFQNLEGRTDQYGPDIQFDSKGVDFGSWIRRFRAQIYRNWTLPYAARSMHGHVVLTFTINRAGRLSDLSVRRPSAVDAFTNSAFNAMSLSNPTHPLPPEYPEESVVFTVTFYFNETPPSRLPRSR